MGKCFSQFVLFTLTSLVMKLTVNVLVDFAYPFPCG
jgi:hypothetical protein